MGGDENLCYYRMLTFSIIISKILLYAKEKDGYN